MPISEMRLKKEEVIEKLHVQIFKGESLLQDVDNSTDIEANYTSWHTTTQKVLQSCFTNEEIAKKFLLNSKVVGIIQLRRDKKIELIDSLTKSIRFIKSLIVDILNGLHDRLQSTTIDQSTAILVIQRILTNFHLHLKAMYHDSVHGNAKMKMEDLERIKIGNEYDVQRILYALIKPMFPEARLEVTEDAGYKSVRYDIFIDEFNLAIEVKCTRPNMTERNLTEELGADSFHYKTKNLFLFIYDKEGIVTNAEAFRRSFKREQDISFDKNIDTYIVQPIVLL